VSGMRSNAHAREDFRGKEKPFEGYSGPKEGGRKADLRSGSRKNSLECASIEVPQRERTSGEF